MLGHRMVLETDLMALFLVPTQGASPSKAWRQLRGWLLVLGLVATAILFVQLVLLSADPLEVRIARVERGPVEETVSSTKAGSLRSRLASAVSVDVAGTIVAIHARQGTKVRKGDPLVSIDRRDADAALAAARRELLVLESLVGEAR
ncbi:MAG TPA: biotin/lipoyl-binding protein, partial [Planctomycetota bacterium]|nr:biotin/lipoyl-binding protein [Planctomycetota bacterium]